MNAFGETMTSKERWLAVLRHRKPDRVPMDYDATEEVTNRLMGHLGCKNIREIYQRLHIDNVIGAVPKYIGPPVPEGADMYGLRYKNVRYGSSEHSGVYRECIYHPLANFKTVAEIEREYEWPTVEWFDYSVIPDQLDGWEDHPVTGGYTEPFLFYKDLRGQKQAFLDLYLNPDMVHYCLDKLFGFCYENIKLIFEQASGEIMLSYVAEDLGSQTGLLYSPDHIREFFIPRMKRIIDLVHHYGAYVYFHSDGAIKKIIPDLIDAGIDILNPVQWRCKGMDRERLKRDFGDKVVFHGAMDNQYTLAFGSEMEVRQEVRDNLSILGKGGGYILAPCHAIQPISPLRNIIAMYDEGYNNSSVY